MAVGEYALLTTPQLGLEWTLNTELNSEVKPEADIDMAPREGKAVYMKGTLPPTTPRSPQNPARAACFCSLSINYSLTPPPFYNSFPPDLKLST